MNTEEAQDLINRVSQHNKERWALEKAVAPFLEHLDYNLPCGDGKSWKFMGADNGKVRLWHYCGDHGVYDDNGPNDFTIMLSVEELMGSPVRS